MGAGRINYLNRELKTHDSQLFVQETKAGRLDVYRKSSFGGHPPHYIFSLTDSWTTEGKPIEWGVDVIINRIKAHDIWRDDSFVENIIRDLEKAEEGKKRDFRNSVESFLLDFRRQFAKATDSVNTGTLNKIYREGQ